MVRTQAGHLFALLQSPVLHLLQFSPPSDFTVMKSNAGEFVYAEMGPQGQLSPTQMRVGHMTPAQEQGMQPGLRPSFVDCKQSICDDDDTNRMLRGQAPRRTATTTGTVKNLVVLMKWSDHEGRALPTTGDIDTLMNNDGPHSLCPTGSLRDTFLENSYGALTLDSVVAPWVPMDRSESFYANGNSG